MHRVACDIHIYVYMHTYTQGPDFSLEIFHSRRVSYKWKKRTDLTELTSHMHSIVHTHNNNNNNSKL